MTNQSQASSTVVDVRAVVSQLFKRYHKALEDSITNDAGMYPKGTDDHHLRWMCEQAILNERTWPEDKLNRWLGFIQGVLCMKGYVSVEGEREFSRPLFHAAYAAASIPIPPSSL